jgi:NAD(P)H-hydrate epimerase
MLTFSEAKVLDGNAEALGVPLNSLMRNAGKAVAEEVLKLHSAGKITVLAGPGNNGGDGLVAARILSENFEVDVVLAKPQAEVKSKLNREAFSNLPSKVKVVSATDLSAEVLKDRITQANTIVDSLLGAGIKGELDEPYKSLVKMVNKLKKTIVSVDVPTGLGTEVAIKPEVTVTFHDIKEGMTKENSGRILVRDIGIPKKAETHTGPGDMTLYPKPAKNQHKGEGGTVLVIAGGPYHGAPVICAMAAMRTGADLAIVLTPESSFTSVSSYNPNLITRSLKGNELDFNDKANVAEFERWLEKCDAVAIGPGLGRSSGVLESVLFAVKAAGRAGKPVSIDADAIYAVAGKTTLLEKNMVVTPHEREFQELTGKKVPADIEARSKLVSEQSKALKATILLKGPIDVVADGKRLKLNETGNPAMSHGGTGDSLCGVVAALLAKKMDTFDAARVAAFMNGRAGDFAFAEKSYGLLATDVVEALPRVLKDHV